VAESSACGRGNAVSLTSIHGGVQKIVMSIYMYICLSVRLLSYSKTTLPNVTEFSMHATCDCGLVLVWQRCDMLCTSGFVDDVVLSHDGRVVRHVQF